MGKNKKCTSNKYECLLKIKKILYKLPGEGDNIDIDIVKENIKKIESNSSK